MNGSYQTAKAAGLFLLAEHRLPVLVTEGDQIAVVVEVGEIGARTVLVFAGQVSKLIVAVEMHLEGRAADVGALQQALLDVASPAAASSVGNQSRPENISFETDPA